MERDRAIDTAKGLGILLVVLGHADQVPSTILKYIYAFHMPLFFLLSGYVFDEAKYSRYNWKGFLLNRAKRLAVPYFTMACICYLFFILYPVLADFVHTGFFDGARLGKYAFGILYSRGNSRWLPSCSPLWFLTALFCAENLLFFLCKYGKKRRTLAVLTCAALGALSSVVLPFKLPWNIDTALTAVVFLYCGLLFRQAGGLNRLKRTKAPFFVMMALVLVWSVKYNQIGYVCFDDNKYGNILLMYAGAAAGCLLFLFLSKFIENAPFLQFLGKNTLPIIGYNYVANRITNSLFAFSGIRYLWWFGFLSEVLILVCIIHLIKKIPLLYSLHYGKPISWDGIGAYGRAHPE